MPTPRQGYYNAKGERVPGVTTVLSRFKDSGALIHWANRLAYEPYREARALLQRTVELGRLGAFNEDLFKDCEKHLTKAPDHCDYRVARDTAAGVGAIVHARVDQYIRKGKPMDYEEFRSELVPDPERASQTGFDAFMAWAGSTSFQLVEGEVQLVSQLFNFGGTPDVIMVRGDRVVGDWKSGDLYAEQVLAQLAAYKQLLIENGRNLGDGGHAISINKKTGGFVHRYFTPEEMTRGWKVFSLMRTLYDLVKELK